MKKIILFLSCMALAFAADVKPGDKLAKEQIFVYNAAAAPQSLDPAKVEGIPEGDFLNQLFESLVTLDANDKVRPGVATKWEHSKDFKTWTFYLRKDAKWSDGSTVTAHDFVFAWKRLADPKTASPYASYLSDMKLKNASDIIAGKLKPETLGVRAKDDYTLELSLEDSVPFLDIMAVIFVLSPVPEKLVEKLGDSWSQPSNIIGNGAFKLESFVVNEKAVLVKNPYYWDNKNTVLERIELLQIPSPANALSRYRAGDLHVSTFPLELYEKVKKDYPKEVTKPSPVLCTYYYEFNVDKAPFDDIRVRQALSMALDRNIITDKILKQGQKPAYTFSPPAITGAQFIKNPEWASWDMKKRNEEALRLLNEAGYSKSKPLKFTLLYNTNEGHKKIAIAVSSIWKQNLGDMVNVKLQNQEWKTFLSTRRLGQHQVARAGWCSSYKEASAFLNTFLSQSSNNRSSFKNQEFDDTIQEAYKAQSDEQRALKYAEAEKILYENAPLAPLYFYTETALIKPFVRGFALKPSKRYYFKDVYIVEH